MDNAELSFLQRACDLVGGQAALARALREHHGLKVQQGHVWYWLNRSKKAPPAFAIPIEAVTGGQVTRHDLRPDVFGDRPTPAPTPPAGGQQERTA